MLQSQFAAVSAAAYLFKKHWKSLAVSTGAVVDPSQFAGHTLTRVSTDVPLLNCKYPMRIDGLSVTLVMLKEAKLLPSIPDPSVNAYVT